MQCYDSNIGNKFPGVHSHTIMRYIPLPLKIDKKEYSTQVSISWTDLGDPTIFYDLSISCVYLKHFNC